MTRENNNNRTRPAIEQWRSLDETPSTAEAFAAAEFPVAWDEAITGQARRDFLKVMGASMGLAGLGACVRQPEEKIVPYVKQPEELIPGKPRYFATTFESNGYGVGVVAESHMGRPTHVEGNAYHPASLGATDPVVQASVLELWDPDRSQAVVRRGKIGAWGMFAEEGLPVLSKIDGQGGRGLHILTPPISSPSLGAQLEALQKRLPNAQWHQWTPAHRDEVRKGTELAFGEAKEVRYNFKKAQVVLTVDADILGENPGHIAYSRQLMTRKGRGGASDLRMYAVESFPSSTGVGADHRWRARASEMAAFLQDLAHSLGVPGVQPGKSSLADKAKLVAKDLSSAAAHAVVAVGDHLPAEAHALGHAINTRLGAIGSTVELTESVHVGAKDNRASIKQLAQAMENGEVDVLLVLDGNPVYDAPGELNFAELYETKVKLSIHAGSYYNETARISQWHLPLSHYLETWGDARAYDGTVSLAQPLIAPIYDTKSRHEVVAIFSGDLTSKAADLVKSYWEKTLGEDGFERKWSSALHDGVIKDSAFAHTEVSLRVDALKTIAPKDDGGLEVVLRLCPNVVDGRYANNAWLQETPRPVSRVVWDNAIYLSPKTAERLKLKNDDLVRLSVGGKTVEGPVWVMPGAAPDSLTVHLGYGRESGGEVLKGVGFNAYPLLKTTSRTLTQASVESLRRSYEIVTVQDHWSLEGRNHLRHATKDEYHEHPHFAQEPSKHVLPISLYPETKYEGRSWGMVIDLGACTGCNACMVACQSENNIPVVGKDQVSKAREMHWIRIDRYFEGEAEEPEFHVQPLTCMHCERAPCEPVCPANATVHGPEGLNQMVYNRCIGTRYCSNNCPYKVRRFNFHVYADFNTESLKGQRNPDVTVRGRGVMEKCTYCIQRIKEATIQAEVEDKDKIPDGTIRTACQAACSTNAIVFGDINDAESEVAKLKKSPLNYQVLEELNTVPRTSYLAAISNPNPKVNG